MFQTMNVILYCRRWRETVDFYRQRLELRTSFETDWLVEFHVADGARLSVADERRSRIKSAAGGGLTLTLRVADADATHAWLRGAGLDVAPVSRHPWGARLFRFNDPEGNRVEVWSPCE